MAKTKIEWATHTWNPTSGCSPVSEGCQNCYAARMAKRLAGRAGYPADEPFKVTLHPDRLDEPLRWRKPRNVFVASMGDLFHEDVPDKFIIDVLSIIAEAQQHTFLVLTKRPNRMKEIMCHETIANDVWLQTSRGVNAEPSPWPIPNVWLGVTAENQQRADERIPTLLQIPAAVRFVSVEPMLGPVDLTHIGGDQFGWFRTDVLAGLHYAEAFALEHGCEWVTKHINRLDWVICGGESGPGARPLHPDWVRSLRDKCQETGTSFFFKQWGEWLPRSQVTVDQEPSFKPAKKHYINSRVDVWTGREYWGRVGKKRAGRLLDGQVWDQFPGKEATK